MDPAGETAAKNFAKALTMPWFSKRRFEIAGHTDAAGSKKKNLVLSQARAENVVSFLVANGVDPARLVARATAPNNWPFPTVRAIRSTAASKPAA